MRTPGSRASEQSAQQRVHQLPDVLRVLFVLADTDRSEAGLAILDLHSGLVSLGVQMRTIALGPGRHGGLDSVVPVLSPATRSLGAVTQLRREQRWADAVVCWGVTAAVVQKLSGSRRRTPTVIGCGRAGDDRGLLARFAMRGANGGPAGYDPTAWRDFLFRDADGGVERP